MSGFQHSIKVPKLYKHAAKACKQATEENGSLKQILFNNKHSRVGATYALVTLVYKEASKIEFLLKRTKLLEKEPRFDPWLAKVLIAELLWGKQRLPNCQAKPLVTILGYEQAFRAHLSDFSDDTIIDETSNYDKPRYVRVNTLKCSVNEALELFQEEGWFLQRTETTYADFLKQIKELQPNCFVRDFHVPELLVFPSRTELYNHPGYQKGSIQLQDKASCLPVHLAALPVGSVVLDMCAAPGMKTTQIAASLQNDGLVYAVERNEQRFETLKKIVETADATCVKPINNDVLSCGGADFPDVEYIFVDPSCSGSGMINRIVVNPEFKNPDRLVKLSGFQIKILRSALTRYPTAKKVIYSTCSINVEENEDVVRQVLETNSDFKLVPVTNYLKDWNNFGSPDFGNIGKYCLYARPDEDLTNGFFLAIFERLKEGERNEFYNERMLTFTKELNRKQLKMRQREDGVEEESTELQQRKKRRSNYDS